MNKLAFVLAGALALACVPALAKDMKVKNTPVEMTNAEMDKVVAGAQDDPCNNCSGISVINPGNAFVNKINPPDTNGNCINCIIDNPPPTNRAYGANTEMNNGNAFVDKINPPGNHPTCINCN